MNLSRKLATIEWNCKKLEKIVNNSELHLHSQKSDKKSTNLTSPRPPSGVEQPLSLDSTTRLTARSPAAWLLGCVDWLSGIKRRILLLYTNTTMTFGLQYDE